MTSTPSEIERSAYGLRKRGDIERALTEYRSAADAYAAAGDFLGEAHAIRHAGDILRKLQRFDDAQDCYERAIASYDANAARSDLDLANALRGFALLREAQQQDAAELWQRAELLYAACGITQGVDECRRRLGR